MVLSSVGARYGDGKARTHAGVSLLVPRPCVPHSLRSPAEATAMSAPTHHTSQSGFQGASRKPESPQSWRGVRTGAPARGDPYPNFVPALPSVPPGRRCRQAEPATGLVAFIAHFVRTPPLSLYHSLNYIAVIVPPSPSHPSTNQPTIHPITIHNVRPDQRRVHPSQVQGLRLRPARQGLDESRRTRYS